MKRILTYLKKEKNYYKEYSNLSKNIILLKYD